MKRKAYSNTASPSKRATTSAVSEGFFVEIGEKLAVVAVTRLGCFRKETTRKDTATKTQDLRFIGSNDTGQLPTAFNFNRRRLQVLGLDLALNNHLSLTSQVLS